MTKQIVTVDVVRLGAQGDGIAYHADEPLYIAGCLPGDRVDVTLQKGLQKKPTVARHSIVEKGPNHHAPVCRHFGSCGGCQLQHISDDPYKKWASDKLLSALHQQGLEPGELRPAHFSKPGSRRRVALKARKVGKAVILGYMQQRSHAIVNVSECPVAQSALVALFDPLRDMLAALLDGKQQLVLTLTYTNSGIDILIDGALTLDLSAREALATFAEQHDLAALHVKHDGFIDPVLVRRKPVMTFGAARVGLPPGAFIQATSDGEAALLAGVTEAVSGATHIADLFAGLGTFTLPLATEAHVTAVEGAKVALTALDSAARRTNAIKPVAVMHRDLFRRPLRPDELKSFDAVLMDPPRTGAKEQAAQLAQSVVPVIASVSCNPATFARDARLLVEGGYRLDWVQAVDQFLWSPHLEVVARFSRP